MQEDRCIREMDFSFGDRMGDEFFHGVQGRMDGRKEERRCRIWHELAGVGVI